MSEKEKKELHWKSAGSKTIKRMKILPQTIYCQPEVESDGENKEFPQLKHGFSTDKAYVFLDEKGREEDAIVICPEHQQPISVNINHRSPPPQNQMTL